MLGWAWRGLGTALCVLLALPACSGGTAKHGASGGSAAVAGSAGTSGGGGAGQSAGASAGGEAGSPDSGGQAGASNDCEPKLAECTEPQVCGSVDDGCGNAISCGECAAGQFCQAHACVDECEGCLVGTTCVADGDSEPNDACMACDGGSGTFLARSAGACDDGDACTTGDHCDAGSCEGTPKTCADTVACNGQESCDGATGECVAGTSSCGLGVCDVLLDACVPSCDGCNIAQVCYPSGAANPLNPCEICNAANDATAWSANVGQSCGTDTECAFNHVCDAAGECKFQVANAATPCGTSSPCQKPDHCDGLGACQDAGPQALGFECKANAKCSGSASAPACECAAGAEPIGSACVDVNECQRDTDGCDSRPDACVNDALGFHCACPGNYGGNGVGEGSCTCEQAAWSPLCEPWSMVALGSTHACAISGGALWCWGTNAEGQLGTGDKLPRERPTRVGDLEDWDFIAVGHERSCAIRGGALYCWGNNGAGGLGIGDADSKLPAQVGAASDWTYATAGIGAQCGIRQGGALYCWGWNGHGQMGDGTISNFVTAPSLVSTVLGATTVSVKSDTVCAVGAGKLYCWGGNFFGEVGNGSNSGDVTTPARLTQFDDFVGVDAGVATSCATRSNGALYCWGSPYANTPTQVGSELAWQSVSAGFHECALKQDGSAYCWGPHNNGQLGDGTARPRTLPTEVAGEHAWEQVVASDATSCGIRDGGLYCWGSNENGIRGSGTHAEVVGSDSDWSTVAAGGDFSCALKSSGNLYCWGNYPGSADRASPWLPTRIGQAGDNDWTSIDATYGIACGVKGGDAYCWGANGSGQVGDGTKLSVAAPVRVGASGLWQQLSVGDGHTCGIRDGNLYCWGSDSYGQIGNGAGAAPTAPELIASGGYTQVAAGSSHTCAIKAGAMYCWGDDSSGQVGNGAATNAAGYSSPVAIGGGNDWVAVTAGMSETCGIRQGGALYCWGSFQNTPLAVAGQAPWTAVSPSGSVHCGLQSDDKLYCWGFNQYGQLGTGSFANQASPVAVLGGQTFGAVTTSYYYGCAVSSAGALSCWGHNMGGALGRAEGLVPTPVFDPTVE